MFSIIINSINYVKDVFLIRRKTLRFNIKVTDKSYFSFFLQILLIPLLPSVNKI